MHIVPNSGPANVLTLSGRERFGSAAAMFAIATATHLTTLLTALPSRTYLPDEFNRNEKRLLTLAAITSWVFRRITTECFGRGLSEFEAVRLCAYLGVLLFANVALLVFCWISLIHFESDCGKVSTIRYIWCYTKPWLLHSILVGLWINALACAFFALSLALVGVNLILQVRKRRHR